jgi:hypothetical protein
LQQIIVFAGSDDANIELASARIRLPEPLPAGAMGWDLGPPDSAVWPGFQRLTSEHAMLRGQHLQAVDRGQRKQAADALTRDGIRGIEQLHLPLPEGHWRITVWLRDSGEWEYLPHPLERYIDVNERRVYQQQQSPDQWVAEEYLRGHQQLLTPASDSWNLFGHRPRQQLSFEHHSSGDGITLNFSGQQPEAGFVAALLAEPASSAAAYQHVTQQQATWWRQNWPVANWPQPLPLTKIGTLTRITTANNWVRIRLQVKASIADLQNIEWHAPSREGLRLNAALRFGHWRLRRSSLSSTLLKPDDDWLRASPPVISSNTHQRLEVLLYVPKQTPPGNYHGQIIIGHQQWPLQVTVLPMHLPEPDRPVGVYLETPVHFQWFEQQHPGRVQQALVCDLSFLRGLGLTGIAPPLATPSSAEQRQRLQQQLTLVQSLGFLNPILAYTPFKRLVAQFDLPTAFQRLHDTDRWLRQQGLTPPVWVTADEPSNPSQQQHPDQQQRYGQLLAPNSQRAGHLNHHQDDVYTSAFDLALVNDGYGLNEQRLRAFKPGSVWLYNLNDHIRLAAGFFLWRSSAGGYLQWHARMPTADPFDPTDGREDDAQLLYPMAVPCPITPDIDASLLDLAEGIQDLRWLLWLEEQALKGGAAKQLLNDIKAAIDDNWWIAKQLSHAQLQLWRQRILALAIADQ